MKTKKTAELLECKDSQRVINIVKNHVDTIFINKQDEITRTVTLTLIKSGADITAGNIRIFAEYAGLQLEATRRKEINKALSPQNIFEKAKKIINKSYYYLAIMDKEDLVSETITQSLDNSKTEIITEGLLYLCMHTAARELNITDKTTAKKYRNKLKSGTITGAELQALEAYDCQKNTVEVSDIIANTVADSRPTADIMLQNGWIEEMQQMLDTKINETNKTRYSAVKKIISLVLQGYSITEAAKQLDIKPKTAWQYLRSAGQDYNNYYN